MSQQLTTTTTQTIKSQPPKRIPQKKDQAKKDELTLYFHSVTVPQLIQQEANLFGTEVPGIGMNDQTVTTDINKKLTSGKMVLHVLYYQRVAPSDKFIVKRRRFVIGKKDIKDISDGIDMVNPLTAKGMRSRMKDFLISGSGFDLEKTKKLGGFLSKQFWQANLSWGTGDSLQDNLYRTATLVKAVMPIIGNGVVSKIRADKTNKKKVAKTSAATATETEECQPLGIDII